MVGTWTASQARRAAALSKQVIWHHLLRRNPADSGLIWAADADKCCCDVARGLLMLALAAAAALQFAVTVTCMGGAIDSSHIAGPI